jgi:hypothetical protein
VNSAKCFVLAVMAAALLVSTSSAAKPTLAEKVSAAKQPANQVEMFAAIKAGDIDVKLIPKDSTTGIVMIKNKTNKPLTIQLPAAFAGVPVLGQIGIGGGIGGGAMGGMGGGGGMGGQNQAMGGGMMGGGMGGMGGMGGGGFGGGGMGGGFFNVGPEKVGKIKFAGVCLEHGKADPNPRVPYEIRPIDSYTKDPQVIAIVQMLGRGEIDQHTAQAATWHLENDMSWQELASKVGAKHLDGSKEPYFTHSQLELALRITREAARRVDANPDLKTASPGEEISLSQQ